MGCAGLKTLQMIYLLRWAVEMRIVNEDHQGGGGRGAGDDGGDADQQGGVYVGGEDHGNARACAQGRGESVEEIGSESVEEIGSDELGIGVVAELGVCARERERVPPCACV